MKHNQSFAEKIVNNISHALESLPRVLNQEKEIIVRTMKSTAKKSRKSAKRSKARKGLGARARKLGMAAKRGAKKAARKSAKVLNLKRRPTTSKKKTARKSRRFYSAPLIQAA